MEHLELKEGFRFHPTDSEGLSFLLRFVAKQEMHDAGFITTNIDVYGNEEPWEIYSQGVPCGGSEDEDADDCYRYFITKLKKKSTMMYHREVGNKGSWKQQGEENPVYNNMGNSSSALIIGCKKSMRYVNKEHKDGDWLMKEYELSKVILQKFDEDCRDYVLCAIKKKPIDTCSPVMSTTTSDDASEETDEVTGFADSVLATSDDNNM
ncbi:NAC domain-containing protein 1-like [Lycium ferocissimum]|uniref:NAC domain-containing protein 1-like n=1 Tax=Lycium ferocissimum TaxID=112874 RepID=UPI0028166402|nr:NAC domain-containing protein 1-like [Lycium ferocissimum]